MCEVEVAGEGGDRLKLMSHFLVLASVLIEVPSSGPGHRREEGIVWRGKIISSMWST